MAQTPEGKVKDKVKRLLKKHGCYYFMPVQSGYGASTIDILVCHKGEFIGIETKAPGKKASARQEIVMAMMEKAGAKTFLIDGDLTELEEYLA